VVGGPSSKMTYKIPNKGNPDQCHPCILADAELVQRAGQIHGQFQIPISVGDAPVTAEQPVRMRNRSIGLPLVRYRRSSSPALMSLSLRAVRRALKVVLRPDQTKIPNVNYWLRSNRPEVQFIRVADQNPVHMAKVKHQLQREQRKPRHSFNARKIQSNPWWPGE
jgi:hypothetical protein